MDPRLEKLEEYEEKLRQLQTEVAGMALEIKKMKLEMKGVTAEKTETLEPLAAKPAEEPGRFDNPVFTAARTETEQTEGWKEPSGLLGPPRKKAEKSGKDLERAVGRSLMGIFASVLIFISLILFATLLLPYFNDTAKMITTYLVSAAFLGSGLFLSTKDGNNKFYQALTACGIGGIYISLMLSCAYFGVIGQIPLYILLAVWGAGVCFLARKKENLLFHAIGELGILIAVVFGCVLCADKNDNAKFMAVQIFFLLSYVVFYAGHYRREYADNKLHTVSAICNLAALYFTNVFWFSGETLSSILLFAITAVCLGFSFSHSVERQPLCFNVLAGIQVMFLLAGYYMMFAFYNGDYEQLIGLGAYLLALALIVFCEWRAKGKSLPYYGVEGILLLSTSIAFAVACDFYLYGALLFVVLPCIVYGVLRDNKAMKYAGLVMFFLFSVQSGDYVLEDRAEVVIWFLLGACCLAAAYALLYLKKEKYDMVWKYALHCFTVYFIVRGFYPAFRFLFQTAMGEGYSIHPTEVSYIVFALFNFLMYLSPFRNNLRTGEKEAPYVFWCFNGIAMFLGMVMLYTTAGPVMHFVLILLTVLLFFMNAVNLLENRENYKMGIYVGLKFTVLMIVILKSFTDANYIISIACLLFAIAVIVLGFGGKYKALRIYGLVLSMISTFKLVMIDISYENTLGHAVSFFVAGILCFAISMIYNYIDKKIGNEE